MSHTRMLMLLWTRAAAAIIAMLAMSACEGSPTGPESSRSPLAPRFDGPASIAPGAAAEYRLVVPYSDGTNEDITASALWGASDQRILSVAQNRVTALQRGETDLVATVNGRTHRQHILVLEAGTFRLTGIVRVAGAETDGVEVRVVSGIGAGLTATTAVNGEYRLYGVVGDVQIDVMHRSLQRETRSMTLSAHTTADFDLRPVEGAATLGGAWRLTFNLSPQCVPAFPAELTRRTYDVALLENGTRLNILVGAPLDPTNISARLEGRTVSFEVSAGSYYGLPLWALQEWIPPDLSLGIMGKAVATINDGATAIAGSFSGLFVLSKGRDFFNMSHQASCSHDDHTILLERR